MKLLEVDYGPHPLTEELRQLHEKRLSLAALINNQMITLDKEYFEDMQTQVRIAKPVVDVHLNYLRQNNRKVIFQTIKAFFNHL